ncbi:heavy metal-binding protein HIP-like [Saccostrea echinata]|uniref:heavy metal-binding protein HIP-like n=1 Tax=Saccostrea echinata TaxID=191078 RepID=UPI002A804C6E|nr:heavy metal-binding protein HIP-like [Saccostrea echinata]
MNLLLEELTSLRKTVFALENKVHHQSGLIDDLKERNTLQERRITELEAAQHRRDKVCEEMKIRLEKTESRLINHFSASSDPVNITTKSNGEDIPKRRLVRSGRLLMNPMNSKMPPYEEGVIAFYAQMSSSEVSPGAHHTLIFDNVRTNVGNGYSGVTGVFTAPQEGIYAFIWVIRVHEAEHSTELMINNDILGATFLRAKNGDDGSVSGTAIAHVARGDVVFVRIHSTYAGDGNVLSNVHGMPTFSGWLLH